MLTRPIHRGVWYLSHLIQISLLFRCLLDPFNSDYNYGEFQLLFNNWLLLVKLQPRSEIRTFKFQKHLNPDNLVSGIQMVDHRNSGHSCRPSEFWTQLDHWVQDTVVRFMTFVHFCSDFWATIWNPEFEWFWMPFWLDICPERPTCERSSGIY